MVREERVERREGHGTQRARARERRRVRGSERGSEHERQRVRVHERARERARSRARARARARARVKYPQMRKPDLRKRVIKKDTTVLHKRALWNTRDSPIKNTKEHRLFCRAVLQKRPIILSILLTKATPYGIRATALSKTQKNPRVRCP